MLALLASLAGCAQPAAGPITGSGTVEAPEIAVMAEIGGRVITVTADAGAPGFPDPLPSPCGLAGDDGL